jgi:hypothetical protein
MVKQEIWTAEVLRKVSTLEKATFLDGLHDFSRYANNNVIHMAYMGVEPKVLINNTTYPLPASALPDEDIGLSLDKYQTEVTVITDDELHANASDLMSVTRDMHAGAIAKEKFKKALHAIAPAKHTKDTPVLSTTGEEVDGRKALKRSDIIRLKKAYDLLEVPIEGRRLVLCPDHIHDLLEWDQKFSAQYYQYQSGRIAGLYGFDVYEYGAAPYYDQESKTKKAFNVAPAAKDVQASVAFYAPHIAKASGETKMYFSEARNNPRMQENEINFRHYFLVIPKKQLYLGAILSSPAGSGK